MRAMQTVTTLGEKPRTTDGWTEIRSSRGRLLCRLDVGRMLLEVKQKGQPVELVDLRPLLAAPLPSPLPGGEGIGERVQLVD